MLERPRPLTPARPTKQVEEKEETTLPWLNLVKVNVGLKRKRKRSITIAARSEEGNE